MQPAVEGVLVDRACLTVHGDELGFEAARVGMSQKVGEHFVEHDVHPVRMPNKFLPPGPLALDEVLGLLVLQFHFCANLLEADAQGFLVHFDGHGVADVVHLQGRAVLDGAVDAVVA